ncbi:MULTISPECIES: DUF2306 domain-containing protein [unclassified Mycobacterium]|uniref:DUF2306 domain-containing protein n=1 Tax=unclassified Mycobacterium TaxID=2642494 RepID=UPI00073FE282|nr:MULTISPECIES: DUF2306 domain-containing protein [unclassified Mycobacterium]KUH81519.1 hypothetical protein AU185_16850 [Mycobacterium sp. GA-0227b]KUH83646.1 hypothetical protein AU186_16545 [Mycobacterium sp. GA-1999]
MTYASSARPRWLAPGLAVVVAGFLAFSVPPYFAGGTRVPATFPLHYPLLVIHVMLASVAMVAAVVQIWPRLRARRPALHRRCGRIYVATAIPAAASAMVIGAASPFGPLLAVSNVVLAALWLWFTVNGFLAARQRRLSEHRRHVVRSATLALSVITNRIWTPIIFVTCQPLQDSVFGGDPEHFLWFAAGLGGWLGWTVPLGVVQWWLIRRPLMASSSIRRLTQTPRV